MTEEEHRRWVADVTRSWPEPEPAGNDAWAVYFAEQRRQLRAQVRRGHEEIIEALVKTYKKDRETTSQRLETHMAAVREEFREERALTRKRLDEGLMEYREQLVTLKAEINELRALQLPRLVSGR